MNPEYVVLSILSALCGVAACGSNASQRAEAPERHELAPGLTVEADPGAIRERDTDVPRVWLAEPTGSVIVRSGPEKPPKRNLRVSNRPPSGELRIRSARYRTGDEFDRCSSDPSGSVECPGPDSVCQAVSAGGSNRAATTASLSVEMPSCAEVRFDFEWTIDRSEPFRIGLVGPAGDLGRLGDAVDRHGDAARLMVLTGDYANSSDAGGLSELADALEDRSVPLVVMPGEREVSPNSRRAFTRRFGTLSPSLDLGGVQFLGFPSPRQSLAGGGVDGLDSRLSELERDNPIVAFTHTAPTDPAALRDQGFRSRIEASRTLSTLATYRTDLLLAGHLPDRQRAQYGDVDLVVPPKLGEGGPLFVELRTRTAGADGKLEISVEDGSR